MGLDVGEGVIDGVGVLDGGVGERLGVGVIDLVLVDEDVGVGVDVGV
jgi:hypothetical protein